MGLKTKLLFVPSLLSLNHLHSPSQQMCIQVSEKNLKIAPGIALFLGIWPDTCKNSRAWHKQPPSFHALVTYVEQRWGLSRERLGKMDIDSGDTCFVSCLLPAILEMTTRSHPSNDFCDPSDLCPNPGQGRLILGYGEGFCTLRRRSTGPRKNRWSWIWVVALVLISFIMLDCLEPLCVSVNQANEPCLPLHTIRHLLCYLWGKYY